jgi:hypothetical protein
MFIKLSQLYLEREHNPEKAVQVLTKSLRIGQRWPDTIKEAISKLDSSVLYHFIQTKEEAEIQKKYLIVELI